MTNDSRRRKVKALSLQCIEISGGVILKRGCTELRIIGEGVVEGIQRILTATADSGATKEEICELFPPPSRPIASQIIERLLSKRLLVPEDGATQTDGSLESELDVFYWHFDETAAKATDHLNERHLAILGINYISRQLVTCLTTSGWVNLQVVDDPLLRNPRLFDKTDKLKSDEWPTLGNSPSHAKDWAEESNAKPVDCLIATSDLGVRQVVSRWNTHSIQNQNHFLPVVLRNMVGYIGPLVAPGQTACYECARARQNANLEEKDLETRLAVEAASMTGEGKIGFHPAMAAVLGDIAAFELTKFYSGVMPTWNVGTLIEVNLLAARMTPHKVLKVPRCPACSPLNTRTSTISKKDVLRPINQINI